MKKPLPHHSEMKPSQRGKVGESRLRAFDEDAAKRISARKKEIARLTTSRGIRSGNILAVEKPVDIASRFSDNEKTLNQHSKAIPTKRLESGVLCEDDYFLDATETDTVPSASSGSPVITTDAFVIMHQGSECNFASTASSLGATKIGMSKFELQETRRKAASRLTAKRREMQLKLEQDIEKKRQSCTLHRVKWRANAKGKRSEELDRQVDKFILRDVILNNPKALAFADQHDFNCVTGRFDESVWGDLLNGLKLPAGNKTSESAKDDDNLSLNPRISEQILNSVGLSSGSKLHLRSRTDGDDDYGLRSPVARTFIQRTLPSPMMTKVLSSSQDPMDEKSRLNIETSESNFLSFEALKNSSADEILANQNKCSATAGNTRQNAPGRNSDESENRVLSAREPKKKLQLFSKFIPPDKKRGEERCLNGEKGFSNTSTGALNASSCDETSCNGDRAHSVRLADSVFLVGPGDEDIEFLVQQYFADGGGAEYSGNSSKSISKSSIKISEKSSGVFSPSNSSFSSSIFERNIEPKLIYLSDINPEIEGEVLPFFCFPSGVTVRLSPVVTSARNRSLSRGGGLSEVLSSPVSQTGAALSSIGNSRCFTFILANNTSHQYGVCLQLPRTFKDISRGILVQCDYCVCIITKLPFLSYFFNLLMQFESLGGIDFTEPLTRYSGVSPPHPPALRMLIEFTRHLQAIKVPLYRLGCRYLDGVTDDDDDCTAGMEQSKSSYQAISFLMAVRTSLPAGSFSQLLDAISAPNGTGMVPSHSSTYAPLSPISRSKTLAKRSLNVLFRRDLMGNYSTLPLVASMSHKNIPQGLISDPPYLPSPKSSVDDNLLGQLEEDREKEVCFHTLLWALPALLRHLPLDQIILAIGCALTEMRVVVVGEDLGVVSGCVLALVNLLRPLKWAGPVIVTLPSSLHAYLESPVPLILGMQSLPEGFRMAPGIIMIDPKERMVNLHQTDVVASHTLILPKAHKLTQSLRATGEIILRLSRKRTTAGSMSPMTKESSRRSTSPQGMLRHSLSLSGPIESSSSPVPLPSGQGQPHSNSPSQSLPIELDAESANGKKLMSAVCGFSATMAAHLETIVNTVLQHDVEEKRNKRRMRQEASGSRALLKENKRRHSLVSLLPPHTVGGGNRGTDFEGLKEFTRKDILDSPENENGALVKSKRHRKKGKDFIKLTSAPVLIPREHSFVPVENVLEGLGASPSALRNMNENNHKNGNGLHRNHDMSNGDNNAQNHPNENNSNNNNDNNEGIHNDRNGSYSSNRNAGVGLTISGGGGSNTSSLPTPTPRDKDKEKDKEKEKEKEKSSMRAAASSASVSIPIPPSQLNSASAPSLLSPNGAPSSSSLFKAHSVSDSDDGDGDSDSESDSNGDGDGDGDDRSHASTMTGTASSVSLTYKPNIKTSAVFNRKELGEGGVRFLARVRESQMFCNYCHSQSLRRRAMRAQTDREAALSMVRMNTDLGLPHDLIPLDTMEVENNLDPLLHGVSPIGGNRNSGRIQSVNSTKISIPDRTSYCPGEEDEDCLITLFKIMLTGTIPMKQKTLNSIIASYEKDEVRIRNDNGSRKYTPPVPTSTSTSTSFLSSSVGASCPNKNKNVPSIADMKILGRSRDGDGDGNVRSVEDDIVWCNGRCNGTADGPLCSTICIKLWSERVLQARKTMTVKQAIARQHHSDIVMSDVLLPFGERISIRPRAEVVKHSRETNSQYEIRLKADLDGDNVNLNKYPQRDKERGAESARSKVPAISRSDSTGEMNVKPYNNDWCGDTSTASAGYSTAKYRPHVFSTLKEKEKEKEKMENEYPILPPSPSSPLGWHEEEGMYLDLFSTYNNTSSPGNCNPMWGRSKNENNHVTNSSGKNVPRDKNRVSAAHAIAMHYRRRQELKIKSTVSSAIRVLAPFLLRCVRRLRHRKRYASCVMIQSFIRGYFIRRDAFHLVLFLRFRKALRKLACLFIRNWCRKLADNMHRKLAAKKAQKAKGRTVPPANLSIFIEEPCRATFASGPRSMTARTDISSLSHNESSKNTTTNTNMAARKHSSFSAPSDTALRNAEYRTKWSQLEVTLDMARERQGGGLGLGETHHGRERDREMRWRRDPPGSAGKYTAPQGDSGRDGDGTQDQSIPLNVKPDRRRSNMFTETLFNMSPSSSTTNINVTGSGHSGSVGGSGISPREKRNPMRKLSIQLGEKAKGVLGFLRRGHRASSSTASIEMGGSEFVSGSEQSADFRSHDGNQERNVIPDSERSSVLEQRLIDDALNASLGGQSDEVQILTGDIGGSRSSTAILDATHDYAPRSRQSFTSEANTPTPHTQKHSTSHYMHYPNSTNSSIFNLQDAETPESLPPRVPANGGIANLQDSLKAWLPLSESANSATLSKEHKEHSKEHSNHVQDSDSKGPWPHEFYSSIVSYSPDKETGREGRERSRDRDRVREREAVRNGSLTSVNSNTTSGSMSPDKYLHDRIGRVRGGRSGGGFGRDSDPKIPVFMRSAFKPRDGDTNISSHLDTESFDSEGSEVESKIFDPLHPGLYGQESRHPRSHSANFTDLGMVDFRSSLGEKRGVSFVERSECRRKAMTSKHPVSDPKTFGADSIRESIDSFATLMQQGQRHTHGVGQGQGQREGVGSFGMAGQSGASCTSASPSRRTSHSSTINSHSASLSPLLPLPLPLSTALRASPEGASSNTPLDRPTALLHLDSVLRPDDLVIPESSVLDPRIDSSSPKSAYNAEEGVSSRSRQNSDASENYDVLLGIDNNFSMDHDDSQRLRRMTSSRDSSLGDDEDGNIASDGSKRIKYRSRNRPSSIVLRSLGSAAKGNITPQQLHILLRMRELLRTGVDVLKHGRGGRPKKRILFCEFEFTKLCWRRPTDPSRVSEVDPLSFSPAPPKRRYGFLRRLLGPANGFKCGLVSRAGWVKSGDDRTMLLRDIVEVRDDIGTDVMRRSLAKQFVAGSEQTCVISIVLATRTLDFEIEEHSWRPIFHALQILVNYYRVILPSVQTQRLSEDRRAQEGKRGQPVG